MARGFKVADAYVEVTLDRDALNRDVRDIPRSSGPDMDRSGRDLGDKLSMGIRMSVIRNSPVIAAAVAGGLAAGAPLLLAGATTLFAGIGAAAAAQSVAVRSAWRNTWTDIKAGAVADAGVLVPTFVGMADKIGAGFQRMRPLLRDAFEAVGPQIDTFTDSLIRAAENALPGLVTAVQRGGPVIEGLGSLMESFGSGIGEMFLRMSEHSEAAGTTFDALGRIVGALLPILGSLMGAGTQLASVILPPIASILEVVADALGAVQGILPAVAGGFLALKTAQAATGWIGGLGDALSRAKGSLLGMSPATAALTATIGGAIAIYQRITDQSKAWATALLEGGAAAQTARSQMGNLGSAMKETNSGFGGFITNLLGMGTPLATTAMAIEGTSDAYKEMLASMDPVSRSKALLQQATNDLSAALEGEGRYANDVAGAQAAYDAALAESERAAADLETAINGVTTAMVEQANQALAAANGQFAYEQAIDSTEDSLAAYTEAVAEFGAGSEEASDAARRLSMDMLSQAEAAGRAAQESSGLGDSLEGQQVAASATLTELYRLRDLYGAQFPPALQNAIRGLEASGVAIGGVSANSVIAQDTVKNFVSGLGILGQQRPAPSVTLQTQAFDSAYGGAMSLLGVLGGQRPTPVASLNANPFSQVSNYMTGHMSWLNSWRPSPVATLYANTWNAENAINWAARNRTAYINVIQSIRSILPFADGGAIQGFADGGPVTGPGGPRDDLIPAIGPGGARIRLSNGEHILDAMDVVRLGGQGGVYALRQALDAGMRPVMVPPARRFADGGDPGGSVATMSRPASTGTQFGPGSVVIKIDGTLDRAGARRTALMLREEIQKLERELS